MPPEEIRATGQVARLTFKRHPLGQPVHLAEIFDVVTGQRVGLIQGARIQIIDEGIKIAGYEGEVEHRPQLWWCLPLTPEQNSELKATLLRIRP
jgi:hypothetical protein